MSSHLRIQLSTKILLENALTDNIAPGVGDAAPPMFFVG